VNKISTKISRRIRRLNEFFLLKGRIMKININAINATESLINQAETNVLYLGYYNKVISYNSYCSIKKKIYKVIDREPLRNGDKWLLNGSCPSDSQYNKSNYKCPKV